MAMSRVTKAALIIGASLFVLYGASQGASDKQKVQADDAAVKTLVCDGLRFTRPGDMKTQHVRYDNVKPVFMYNNIELSYALGKQAVKANAGKGLKYFAGGANFEVIPPFDRSVTDDWMVRITSNDLNGEFHHCKMQ